MTSDALLDALAREPFQAFRVWTSGGQHYDVLNPHMAALMKSRLFIALPNSDRSVMVSYLHITALETLDNGHKKKAPRRRPPRGK